MINKSVRNPCALLNMATTKFFLDTRRAIENVPSSLKIAIRNNNTTAYLGTGVRLLSNQWDSQSCKVINHPMKQQLNARISKFKSEIDIMIFDLAKEQNISKWKATDLKKVIEKRLNPNDEDGCENTFMSRALKFTNTKNPRTKEIYEATIARMRAFDSDMDKLKFEDISVEWLNQFESFLAKTAPSKNARNIHLRNIRAIFNSAIDDEITAFYPFRKFKIKGVVTPKRSLTVEQLRQLFNAKPEPHAEKYLDAFKLIFFLCGINIIDLCNLDCTINGRIEYYRAKTHRFYSIKIEPEAAELIKKYKGESHLLNYLDNFKSYKDFGKYLNKNIKLIGEVRREGRGGRKIHTPLFPTISSYWARHSWATIAASLDIPKETIAAALGHEIGSKITSIYIDFDQKKVDEANRRVIDWVLYGKK